MRPSITKQLQASLIPQRLLKDSPRNYNPSICRFNGRVWMAYRSHRPDGRCGIAICEFVDGDTAPKQSQWLDLGGATGGEHHEDPRLFIFNGEMHVAFIETVFPPNRNYIAVQKYARLKHSKGWKVAEVFRPRFGKNYAEAQEKNWQFFERNGKLCATYSSDPLVFITLVGDRVVDTVVKPGVVWPWGEVRGGTPPIRWGGLWLTFFHSSTPAIDGAWRRYWMGAMTFDDDFNVVGLSSRPLAGGSEADEHGHDPREGSNWKPYVVFPGGAIDHKEGGWLVALGVNDWRCALARITSPLLMPPPLSYMARYFKAQNGSRPVRMMRMDRQPLWIHWEARPTALGASPGYASIDDPWMAEELTEVEGVREIDKAEYDARFSIKRNAA